MDTLQPTLTAPVDPSRRKTVGRLSKRGATVSELVDRFELAQPTIPSPLEVLERPGLLSSSRVATIHLRRHEPAPLETLGSWLSDLEPTFFENPHPARRTLAALEPQP